MVKKMVKRNDNALSGKSHVYAVILAGGVGSRFWPLSRELEPKQFLKLYGNKSLLQQTIERIKPFIPVNRIYIISNQQHKFEIEEQTKDIALPAQNIILEPEGKNTAPAVGFMARLFEKLNPSATMIVLPADNLVRDEEQFIQLLKNAVDIAQKNYLVTLGITPHMPHTGYGYIKLKKGSKISVNAFSVERFTEKPDKLTAENFFQDKSYFWNSGMFIWRASVILENIKQHLPGLYKQLQKFDPEKPINAQIWHELPSISVDYGILEKARKAAVIVAKDIGWSDLGSWAALSEFLPHDKNGNVIQADNIDVDSKNTTVWGSNHLIATIGLKNIIVVDTADALLVCNRNQTEDVKKIVEEIKKRGRQEHVAHNTVKRPWGSYTVINMGQDFKVKLVQINPHKRLSLQSHQRRSEHWVVVEGEAKITNANKTYFLAENESTYISKGVKHRLENPHETPLKIIEVQCGHYLGEDDIERVEDDFERK